MEYSVANVMEYYFYNNLFEFHSNHSLPIVGDAANLPC